MVKKRPTNISTVTRPQQKRKEVRFNFEESDGDSSESSSNSHGVPEHLLERSRAARARLSG